MAKVELDMIVPDSIKALELYKELFEVEDSEVTNFSKGENEAVFFISGAQFHLLDANEMFGMAAPDLKTVFPIWVSVEVKDIKHTYSKALSLGCSSLQEITEVPHFNVLNASIVDPFGYQWLLNEVSEEVSFKEGIKKWEEQKRQEKKERPSEKRKCCSLLVTNWIILKIGYPFSVD